MKIKTKEPKRKYQQQKCEACQKYKTCTWHHVSLRRYSDDWIWLCVFNGFEEGCHERVHRDVEWAYENGYLIKHNTFYKPKMKKTKACSHSKTLYDSRLGYIRCQYCGKAIDELKFGTKKKKDVDRKPAGKMGYEQQDPRIKQAAEIQNKIRSLTVAIKLAAYDKDKYEVLKEEKEKLFNDLKQIEKSYED